MKFQRTALVLLGTVAFVFAQPSRASTPISLGDFAGDTVVYENVTEVGDGLFGTPFISGNTLDFSTGPSTADFEVEATSGSSDSISSSIEVDIQALAGNQLDQLEIEATGTFDFIQFGGVLSADTSVQAVVRLETQITEIDGVALSTPLALSPVEERFEEDFSNFGGNVTNGEWSGILAFFLANEAAAQQSVTAPITGVSTQVTVSLTATSATGTFSAIGLDLFDQLTLTVIPEPASAGVVLIGLTALSTLRRRRA